MIGKTVKSNEKFEKEMSNLVRCSPFLPLFSWENSYKIKGHVWLRAWKK